MPVPQPGGGGLARGFGHRSRRSKSAQPAFFAFGIYRCGYSLLFGPLPCSTVAISKWPSAEAATNFALAAREANVRRIIYLGGLAHGQDLSPHMRSR